MKGWLENILMAIRSIRTNLVRAILTLSIIAFGIMALTGMLTALDSIEGALKNDFARIGANTFKIRKKGENVRFRHRSKKDYPDITYRQALRFKELIEIPSQTSIHYEAAENKRIRYHGQQTHPQVTVLGVDDNYLTTGSLQLKAGRNFTSREIQYGKNVVIIGYNLKTNLFGHRKYTGQRITIGNRKYTVIGILEERGATLGFSSDQTALFPLKAARKAFSSSGASFEIDVRVDHVNLVDPAIEAGKGLFRRVRKLNVHEENDFEVIKSDQLVSMVSNNLSMIRGATFFIGLITLLGATIGLMNIMLVSVKERTREIGTKKALGATSRNIKIQFLSEALLISQAGGILGIFSGFLTGNILSKLMESEFIVPWGWMILGMILCISVGLIAGYYPASRAARLNPIEALRYE